MGALLWGAMRESEDFVLFVVVIGGLLMIEAIFIDSELLRGDFFQY